MFLFDLTYRAPLSQVDALLPGHIAYLERHYRSGEFLCSGRKTPRTGGVLLRRGDRRLQGDRVHPVQVCRRPGPVL